MKYILLICCFVAGCAKQTSRQDDVHPSSSIRPSESQGARQNIVVLTKYHNKTYQEMYEKLGAPADKMSYTIANATTKGWNHGELFAKYPKNDENKDVQIMEITWDLGDFGILACFHMINGKSRCLIAKRIRKGIRF